jgi:hypothetical protein
VNWSPINLALTEDRPPPQPTIGTGRIVYPGARHIYSGEPESAKTIAGYATLLEEARAGHYVLLADFEMGPDQAKQRLRDLGATDADLGCVLYVEPTTEPTEDDYETIVVEYAPTVAFFDAAAGAFDVAGLDDNKRADAERFTSTFIRPLWTRGVATILADHVTKSRETRGRYTIGSERKLGGADVHLGFETVRPLRRGGNGLVKITTHKDRFGFLPRPYAAELHLVSDPDTHAITWTFQPATSSTGDTEWKPTGLMERVSRYLELAGTAQTRNTICDAVKGKRTYVLEAITVLIADGYAAEASTTGNSKPVRSVKPYREQFPVPDQFPPVPGTDVATGSPGSPLSRGEPGNQYHAANGTTTHTQSEIPT